MKNAIVKIFSVSVLAVISISTWATTDSAHVMLANGTPGIARSYVLATGTSELLKGTNVNIGVTKGQCSGSTMPLVSTGVNDTDWANSSHCYIRGIHASDPKAVDNGQGGYNVVVGTSQVDTSQECPDHGLKISWSVFCMKTDMG